MSGRHGDTALLGTARFGTVPTRPDTVRHGPAWRGLVWLIEVRGLAKCIVGSNESRTLPPALPKHRTLFGIMRSPSKTNSGRRSYCSIGRHLFYVNSRHRYQHQMLHHAASASSISKKQMDSRWRQHGPEMARDAPTWVEKEFNMAQGSIQIGPSWTTWSSGGANMAIR